MESFRAIVEKQLARRGTSAIRAALGAGLTRDAIRSVLRGRSPSVDRAAEICEALDLEFYIGPPRPGPAATQAALQEGSGLGHIRDRRLVEVLGLIVGHWQALESDYARADFVLRLYEREPQLRDAARRHRGSQHRFPKRALRTVSEEVQALGPAADAGGVEARPLLDSLRGLGVRQAHPVYGELRRLVGPQSHAAICQAFLRAGVWLDVHIRIPGAGDLRERPVGVMEWRRPNYRVVYSADLAHVGAVLHNDWVVMLGGDVERLIAEGLVAGEARERHVPYRGKTPTSLVAELVWAPPREVAPSADADV
ncbi:MAG: hypothetical protein OXM56_01645 [Gammaproteobacteria bacterium]|nr:hypothetical protein [Gammaproteobacteria bacterium]